MSSAQDRNSLVGDDNQTEDDGLFTPVEPESFPDSLSGFWGGILLGFCGAALVPVSAWLGGTFILCGYALSGSTLSSTLRSRWGRALRTGFFAAAAIGAALLLGDVFATGTTWALIGMAMAHRIVFAGLVAAPWLIAVGTIIVSTIRSFRSARPAQARVSPNL
jgi:hypothetical protein